MVLVRNLLRKRSRQLYTKQLCFCRLQFPPYFCVHTIQYNTLIAIPLAGLFSDDANINYNLQNTKYSRIISEKKKVKYLKSVPVWTVFH